MTTETRPDRPFVPSRSATSSRAVSVVTEALRRLEAYEAAHGTRKRRRRPKDRAKFVQTVSAVILDAVHRHLTSPNGRISLRLSNDVLRNSNPKKPAAFNAMLPGILQGLSSNDLMLLTVVRGRRVVGDRRLTTFAAGPALVALLSEHGVTARDLADDPEVIELRARKSGPDSKPKAITYRETARVKAWRSQMKAINEWLAGATITFAGLDQNGVLVDTSNRALRRIFSNGRFDHGGRLYGGFWQSLNKQRRSAISIEGEPIAELDYGQCGPRLLYAKAGKPPPHDCYMVPGYEPQREGFKLLWSSLVAIGADALRRYPNGVASYFPRWLKVDQAKALLLKLHAPIAHLVQPDEGLALAFTESEMLVALLLELRDAGIVALPIHDSVLVKLSKAEDTKHIMERVFRDHAGMEGVVRVTV